MRIEIISKWFNEAELAPFFLNHYSYADEIIIYLDPASNDGSKEIINSFPNTRIVWGKEGNKLDDVACINDLNQIAHSSKADWIIILDADEFVFPHNFANPREVLEKADGNLIISAMWDMYKHETEPALDFNNLSIMQRRHGNRLNKNSIKPNIVRPEIKLVWGVGAHEFYPNSKVQLSSTRFDGAHWQSVDIDLAVKRRIKGGTERMSEYNLKNGLGFHNFDLTREKLEAFFYEHRNEPQVF